MASTRMRVALIGVGHWHAEFYAGAFRAAGAEIVGASDPDPAVAERRAAIIGCPGFPDYRALIARTRPDFLMVMARHADMPHLALDLLDYDLPMGLEKPLGVSAEQIAPLVAEVAHRGTFAAVSLVNRYSRLWEELQRLEENGRVGLRSHAHFRIINGTPHRYPDMGVGWVLDPAFAGGGCLINLGIHAADAFLCFAQEPAAKVIGSALTRRVYRTAVEEMAAALLVTENGVIGTVEAGYSFATARAGGDFEWRVSAANCYLIDRGDSLQVTTLDDGQVRSLSNLSSAQRYEKFGRDTLSRLTENRPPVASVEDCYRAMLLLQAIYAVATQAGEHGDQRSRGDER
jgi:predicted dehydrogenase